MKRAPWTHAGAGGAAGRPDGGIRRGTDVPKTLALGARAVSVGRPYLYGPAAVGPLVVVVHVIRAPRDEPEAAMALTGCATIGDIGSGVLFASIASAPATSRSDA